MANREELAMIRGARAGRADEQLALGKRYLFGGAGLPKNLPTALHWLDRAAQQGCTGSIELIGAHIPFDVALQSSRPVLHWYERAAEAGVAAAALVLAQLILGGQAGAAPPGPAARAKAIAALETAAAAGLAEAQWLLAQQRAQAPLGGQAGGASPARAAGAGHAAHPAHPAHPAPVAAPLSLLDSLWEDDQAETFLSQALPLARALLWAHDHAPKGAPRLRPDETRLVSRCARALAGAGGADEAELHRLWELAAGEHERHAQLALGLWYARMGVDGKRIDGGNGSANFKKAIRWLGLAGGQGLAEAWYALSRIYSKPEFSQRNVHDAQRYLERAAEMGYREAQLECGHSAWRARRENENNDVRAVYWLQKAAAQGCAQAQLELVKIAPRLSGQAGPDGAALSALERDNAHPLLAARLELAALFGLSRAEALLLDVPAADHGHCLVIDIRGSYGRSKRRLVTVDGSGERRALDRIVRLFDGVDCGPGGPEGNYRQRLYRLKTLTPANAPARRGGSQGYGLAA